MLEIVRARWVVTEGGLSVDARVLHSVEAIGKGEWQAPITTADMVRLLQDADSFGTLLGGKDVEEVTRVLRGSIEPKLDEFAKKKLCY